MIRYHQTSLPVLNLSACDGTDRPQVRWGNSSGLDANEPNEVKVEWGGETKAREIKGEKTQETGLIGWKTMEGGEAYRGKNSGIRAEGLLIRSNTGRQVGEDLKRNRRGRQNTGNGQATAQNQKTHIKHTQDPKWKERDKTNDRNLFSRIRGIFLFSAFFFLSYITHNALASSEATKGLSITFLFLHILPKSCKHTLLCEISSYPQLTLLQHIRSASSRGSSPIL